MPGLGTNRPTGADSNPGTPCVNDKGSDSEHLARLLAAVSDGDPAAFNLLYRSCAAHLYGLLLRILKRPDLAEDALQDCFLKVWRKADSYEPGKGAPLAWLSAIARYRALDLLRRRPPEVNQTDFGTADWPDPAEPVDAPNSPLREICAEEDLEALRHCLATLSPEQRQSILLAYHDGYTHQELAEVLHVPLGTVKSWLRRGLLRLNECLHR